MIDDAKTKGLPDVPFRPAGSGHLIARHCMGCDLSKTPLGGRGVPARWRCAACVAKREAA